MTIIVSMSRRIMYRIDTEDKRSMIGEITEKSFTDDPNSLAISFLSTCPDSTRNDPLIRPDETVRKRTWTRLLTLHTRLSISSRFNHSRVAAAGMTNGKMTGRTAGAIMGSRDSHWTHADASIWRWDDSAGRIAVLLARKFFTSFDEEQDSASFRSYVRYIDCVVREF